MKNFLTITDLTRSEIQYLLDRAFFLKHNQCNLPKYEHHVLANLFYENSTRTRISFELAAKKLSIPVINFADNVSSEMKGETLFDTIYNLVAMGIDLLVIRHQEDGLPQKIAQSCQDLNVRLINAGDGQHAHPSQAMLDLMTIFEYKPNLRELKIAIVGDIYHSRVANSLQCVFKTMGINELYLVAPKIWQPRVIHHGKFTESLTDGVENADVIIALRVQKERINVNEQINLKDYCNNYTINTNILKLAKKDAVVLHPGPINRGIEITHDVVDGAQAVILKQVQNGVYMRMAIIEALIS